MVGHRDLLRVGQFGHLYLGLLVALLREGPEIIHVHSYRHPHTLLALLASKILGVPCVLSSHSSERLSMQPRQLAMSKRLFDRTIGRATNSLFARIVCTDPGEVDFFSATGVPPQQVLTLPGGFTPRPQSEPAVERVPRAVLIVSRLEKLRNAPCLEAILADLPDARFSFVGPAIGAEETRRRLSAFPNVIMRGTISDEELEAEYARCDILLHPLDREPFGLVVVEALGHGLPAIIDSSLPLAHYLSGDSLLKVPTSPCDGWSDAVRTLLGKTAASTAIRAAAVDLVDNLRWDRLAARYLGIYSSLGRGPPTREQQAARRRGKGHSQ